MSEVAEFSYSSTGKWRKETVKRGRRTVRPIDITRAGGDRILAKRETWQPHPSGKGRHIVSKGTAPTRSARSKFAAIGRAIAGKTGTSSKVRRRKRVTIRR